MTPEFRDYLGRVTYAAGRAWTTRQRDVSSDDLTTWADLDASDQEAYRLMGASVWNVADSVHFRSSNHEIGAGPPIGRLAWVMSDTLSIDPARYVKLP